MERVTMLLTADEADMVMRLRSGMDREMRVLKRAGVVVSIDIGPPLLRVVGSRRAQVTCDAQS